MLSSVLFSFSLFTFLQPPQITLEWMLKNASLFTDRIVEYKEFPFDNNESYLVTIEDNMYIVTKGECEIEGRYLLIHDKKYLGIKKGEYAVALYSINNFESLFSLINEVNGYLSLANYPRITFVLT